MRSRISDISTELTSDSGSVLWSTVQGEQLELPVVLNFIDMALPTYDVEAVIIEGYNLGDGAVPETAKVGGNTISLVVRFTNYTGNWDAPTAYNQEDVVLYNALYYKLSSGVVRVDATTPDVDPLWVAHDPRTIYVQFPETISMTPAWTVQPTANYPVYGFFEVRVTEPANPIFRRTWKPVRGFIEILYSPTALVP
jgi:hypothetical protein